MLKIQLLRMWWRFTWYGPMGYTSLSGRRCDGYKPIGGHMAQYCLRWRGHQGQCLAGIRPTGQEDVFRSCPTYFTSDHRRW
jgi:hypothetical protein